MKRLFILLLLLANPMCELIAQVSSGNYRVPYLTGRQCTVIEDFDTNPNAAEVILGGANNTTNTYPIVAAADGTVRAIQDGNSAGSGSNNFIWIQHSNGEWTGYFHLRQGSITGNGVNQGNLGVNDAVTAGQTLGLQSNVGAAGQQLRFVCGVPDNVNSPIIPTTGELVGERRNPMICNAPNTRFTKNDPNNSIYYANPCRPLSFSRGFYRIPYEDGLSVGNSRDHLTHGPVQVRLDLVGDTTRQPNQVVAAAAGTIMAIQDTNTTTCTGPGCSAFNNYVWIAHANGEWTKYTHFQTGTVRTAPPNGAGLQVGQNVAAGTYLGDEDDVGSAGGIHLHFEVAVPTNNVTPFQVSGGFVNGYNLIPLFCDIPGGIWWDGDTYTANPCQAGGCDVNINLTSQTKRTTTAYLASDTIDSNGASYVMDDFSSVTLRAGNKIVLRPGFHAKRNSVLHAAIQPCEEPPNANFATISSASWLSLDNPPMLVSFHAETSYNGPLAKMTEPECGCAEEQ